MTATSQAAAISAALQVIDECVRDARPRSFRGEVVQPRRTSAGMWAGLVDQDNVVTLFVPREVLHDREIAADQLLEVLAAPAVAKGDRCAWYLKADRIKVLDDVGPLAAARRGDLEQLREEKVIDRRRVEEFAFSKHWQVQDWPEISKVLVLTSSEAAGWGDFKARAGALVEGGSIEQLDVPVQGEGMVAALVDALGDVTSEQADLVFIVRGGGGWSDLRRFDDPQLARAIARCAVPVVTAIGHHKDASLADLAAAAAFITPTDAAAALDRAVHTQRQGARPAKRRRGGTGPWIPPTDRVTAAARTLADERAAAAAEVAVERARADRYSAELVAARRQLGQSRREHRDLWRFTHRHLLDSVEARVRRRRWAPALGCWAASLLLLGSPVESIPVAAAVLLLCVALAGAGVYVFRGPRRASNSPGKRLQRRLPADGRAWMDLALRARTPRELRLLRSRLP